MPLSINVGLSKKASRNYQSTGVSINVTAELDSALLAKPEELQRQIDDLYAQAQSAMARQIDANIHSIRPAAGQERADSRFAGNGRLSANGQSNGRNGHTAPGITSSQSRAIGAIAERLHIDPLRESMDQFGVELNRLTIRQAIELIDHLKSVQSNGNGHHGGSRR